MSEAVPAILGKIARIQAEVGAIPRNGKGPAQKGGFSYVKAEDILDKVHSLLVQEEVIVVPTIEYTKHDVQYVNNRAMITATIKATYNYIAVEDGSSITVVSVGEGSDIGSDTATRKAATQALKISHLHTFTIPNSEFDDEGYEPVAKGAAANSAPSKAAQTISKAAKPAVNADVKAAQDKIRGFIDAGVEATAVKTIGERIAKTLGRPYDKNDGDIVDGIVKALEAGEIA